MPLIGHAGFGRLEVVDDGERLVCHECGQARRALGTHAWRAHDLSAEKYRTRHGLPSDTSLLAPATRHRAARTRVPGFVSHTTA